MKRKIFFWGLIFLLAAGFVSAEEPVIEEKKGGYAILDRYVTSFQEMAVQGTGGRDALEANLNEIMVELVKVKESGEIDAVFYSRFARMMAITKLVMIPDSEQILKPVIEKEIRHFIKDVMGIEISTVDKIGVGIVANSLAEEILNLQIYLDTKDTRKKLLEDFYKRFSGAQKK